MKKIYEQIKINIQKVTIPKYTKTEEIINSMTHLLGVFFGIYTFLICIIKVEKENSKIAIFSILIYSITMIIMYLFSFLYHSCNKISKFKKIFRVIDHSDIFLFIAGCYTPISLIIINNITGYIMFIFIWIVALIGAFLNLIDLEKYQKLSIFLYLLMGWMLIAPYNIVKNSMSFLSLKLLIYGGISYTVGAFLFVISSRVKYMHSIFHFFVLIGTFLQFTCIYISI